LYISTPFHPEVFNKWTYLSLYPWHNNHSHTQSHTPTISSLSLWHTLRHTIYYLCLSNTLTHSLSLSLCLSVSLSLSLSLTHTHTHTHMYTHTSNIPLSHTHTLTHSNQLSLSHTHTLIQINSLSLSIYILHTLAALSLPLSLTHLNAKALGNIKSATSAAKTIVSFLHPHTHTHTLNSSAKTIVSFLRAHTHNSIFLSHKHTHSHAILSL
jgi:hypothetical protein